VHVCKRWRYIVLGSTFHLRLRLYCTHGTPVADMLAHSPRIPLTVDYLEKGQDIATEDEDGIVLALRQRDRVRRIRLGLPFPKLQRLVTAMEGEFPMLEYLYVGPPTKHSTGLVLPENFQAPQLRYFILINFAFSVGSPLLTMAAAFLVTLVLQKIHPSAYLRPNILLRHLSLIPQLETLTIDFDSPIHNRDAERQLLYTPTVTRTTLPNLRVFGFRGASAYLEALLPYFTTPLLERLQITFLNQLIFSIPHLMQFMNKAEDLGFGSAIHTFHEGSIHMNVYPRDGVRMPVLSIEVGCRHLDWQVASAAQIFDGLRMLCSTVEHLTLEYDGSLKSSEPHEDDLVQWRELIRSFNNVTTLSVFSGLVDEVSRSLILDGKPVLDLLPKLQEIVLPEKRDAKDGDAFASFLDALQVAGQPVPLVFPDDSTEVRTRALRFWLLAL
jgi:hypothetical protein